MKSLAAYGRRLALTLLIALWSISLVRVVVIFVDSNASSVAIGFADLYGSLLPKLNRIAILAIEISLGLFTIATAWWEIHSATHLDKDCATQTALPYQHEAPPA